MQAFALLHQRAPAWNEQNLRGLLHENNQMNITYINELIIAETISIDRFTQLINEVSFKDTHDNLTGSSTKTCYSAYIFKHSIPFSFMKLCTIFRLMAIKDFNRYALSAITCAARTNSTFTYAIYSLNT